MASNGLSNLKQVSSTPSMASSVDSEGTSPSSNGSKGNRARIDSAPHLNNIALFDGHIPAIASGVSTYYTVDSVPYPDGHSHGIE